MCFLKQKSTIQVPRKIMKDEFDLGRLLKLVLMQSKLLLLIVFIGLGIGIANYSLTDKHIELRFFTSLL